MRLLYLENSMWEFDFITKDILKEVKGLEIEFYNASTFPSFIDRSEIIGNNILVINLVIPLQTIITVVSIIKPVVIFYLSDEFGDEMETNIILEKYTQLFFRQHYHSHYTYSENNLQIPLGYVTSFLDGRCSAEVQPLKISNRRVNAAFIGEPKSDRIHMAQVFKQSMKEVRIGFVENQWTLETLTCPPKQCFEIYQNAIFVLCGRGNYKLECFRIYEAIVAGAIPVIAGTTDEIKTTFHYSHRIPPIVHDESWERVVVKCNQLLENPEELQRMQDDLLLWWRETIEDIRGLIRKIENKSLLCI